MGDYRGRGFARSGDGSLSAASKGRRNRQRGQEGEREIVDLCRQDLGLVLKGRRLGQERDSGHDVDIGPLRAQVKRRKVPGPLYQFLENADVLCYRADSKEWLVVMRWPLFAKLAREEVAAT